MPSEAFTRLRESIERRRQIDGLINSGLLSDEEDQRLRLERTNLLRTRRDLDPLSELPSGGTDALEDFLAGLGGSGGGASGPTQAEIDIAIRGLDIREQQIANEMLNAGQDRELAEMLGLGRIDVDQARIDLDQQLGVGQQSQDLFLGVQNIGLQNRDIDVRERLAGNQLSFDRQQLAEQILLARDQMAQEGGFRQQDIDLRVEQMAQDAGFTQQELDIAEERLNLDQMLGTRGMDLQEVLGLGQLGISEEDLALRRELGEGRLNLDRELGFGGFDVQREIAEGRLGLGERNLDLDRELGTGQLELGRDTLGLQREQFVEEQVMNQAALSANPRRVFEAAFAQAGRDPTAGSELLQNFIDF